MSNTPKPTYTPTNVQRFVRLLAADTNLSRYTYALLQSAGEISYDEMATYRAEAYATSIELENAKKHLKLAENALQREQGQSDALALSVRKLIGERVSYREQLAALTAENDFLKEKVVQLGGIIEGFTPKPKPVKGHWRDATTFVPDECQGQVTYTFAGMRPSLEDGTWTVTPEPAADKPAIGPGKGYRWVEVDETLEDYDQLFYSGKWKFTYCVGKKVKDALAGTADNRTYRRKIEPEAPKPTPNPFASYVPKPQEPQYRELGPQEIIQPGDQCQSYFPTVEGKPSVEWFKVLQGFGKTPYYYRGAILFRRPINQAEGK